MTIKDENGDIHFLEDGDPARGLFPVAYIPFIPDETGLVEYNKDGTEIELTYEKGPSAVVDIHWGMEKTLDFYEEVFNRGTFDCITMTKEFEPNNEVVIDSIGGTVTDE